jgi:hypothetical protein
MEAGGLGLGQIDKNNDISQADTHESDGSADALNDTISASNMLSHYISVIHNLPVDSAVNKTLLETDHDIVQLECLRKALFTSATRCERFPRGTYTLKRRINRGERVSQKLAKDCVLLATFIAGGEFDDIQDMLNNMSNSRLVDDTFGTPRARDLNLSCSQGSVNTNQCNCSAALTDLKDIIVQLRTDLTMLTAKSSAQECELTELKSKYAQLNQSDATQQADMSSLRNTVNAHVVKFDSGVSQTGEITQIALDLAMLKEHKNTGTALNRSMIKAVATDVHELKQYKAMATEQYNAILDKTAMFYTLSESLSTTTDSIHLCIKDTAELQLSV